jgi:hypothetical protein
VLDCDVVSIRLSDMRLRRPRQWGACWMATLLWHQLEQSVSLFGQAHSAQASDVQFPGRALEGAVSGRFRRAVVKG